MPARTRTAALAAALVLGIVAGPAAPAAVATAAPHGGAHRTAPTDDADARRDAPDAEALRAALAGLPDADSTAALARVGGSGGSWRGSAGVHDLRSGRPADEEGRFRAGSVTKVFTAAVVLQLAAEKRVALDRPARAYLPTLIPAAYGAVTVRQLLDHTSGIPAADLPGETAEEAYAHRFDRHDPRDMVASATAKDREFAPGAAQHYLNINYTVLGLLIEKVTGARYADEVRSRVLAPLGLRDTYFPGDDPRIKGPHNRGYQSFPRAGGSEGEVELRDVTVWGNTSSWAAGDLISTTADLEQFVQALFRGQVVPEPQLEEMFSLPAPSVRDHVSGDPAAYSAGLSVTTLGGRQVWGKSGGRWGYNTVIGATRDLSRTLVYSVNATDAKGPDMNPTALKLMVATFGAPSAGPAPAA
ncbi:serine hydrolase [Streptomyces sp. 35G-GA-8]|uniref:serine hydrolase domain-containing protein n=1 Tax=Streptomyces sp. 35G-GA-8 TaxID=2939434 RepID=UPI00201F963C|nr:serine hydrolase domain-containing protein [Streptomyces sp. 35G-GA-8]MCL7381803.1 beta-lactamase family protein [Streptomyces sp. 35G-GA-8]